jgi:hypothetical protein
MRAGLCAACQDDVNRRRRIMGLQGGITRERGKCLAVSCPVRTVTSGATVEIMRAPSSVGFPWYRALAIRASYTYG